MIRPLDVEGLPSGLWSVDPNAQFQPGQILGLISLGGEILMTVSDGTTIPPYGIADDVKTVAFTKPVFNERVFTMPSVQLVGDDGYGHPILLAPVSARLKASSIITSSFKSDVAVILHPINGVIEFPAGTALNYDTQGTGVMDSLVAVVSYTYEVAGVPGDDTTRGSGKVTVWNRRGEYITDQFDTLATYPLNAPLYCCNGKFTTSAPCENAPVIAMVTGPPSTLTATLQLLWF
jgi:hypothetical protein